MATTSETKTKDERRLVQKVIDDSKADLAKIVTEIATIKNRGKYRDVAIIELAMIAVTVAGEKLLACNKDVSPNTMLKTAQHALLNTYKMRARRAK